MAGIMLDSSQLQQKWVAMIARYELMQGIIEVVFCLRMVAFYAQY